MWFRVASTARRLTRVLWRAPVLGEAQIERLSEAPVAIPTPKITSLGGGAFGTASPRRRALVGAPLALALGALGYGACGPAATAKSCAYEGWTGMCQLKGVTKIRELESFPRAYAVFEIAYEPMESDAPLSPPTTRFEVSIPSQSEGELMEHLQGNSQVACRIAPGDEAVCKSGRLEVSVPPFQPSAAPPTAPVVEGCKQMETRGAAHPEVQAGKPLEQEFSFEEGSAELSAEGAATVTAIAQLLRANPGWQCVAITGFTTHGESLGLAETRARSIKQKLVEQGLDAGRFVTFAASIGPAQGEERVARPEERRVRLKVLLSK